ncbi:MAG: acyloxyacyl hydrolase [Bacteroidales bacterium]|nr:acyloxyacyl hydrolase [Bacteroidales bacterium]MBN2819986.1 acyloxyacyl hydrolase [Bacteroidales bacterium]
MALPNILYIRLKAIFILFLFVFIVKNFKVNAQVSFTDNLFLGLNYQTGYILPEYQFVNYITNESFHAFDLCLTKATVGKTYWEQLYKYPYYGISFYHSSLGNDKVFGKEFAVTVFFKMDIIQKEKFRLYNRTGVGLGYVTRKFDIENNYLNVAVGSHINIHFNQRLGVGYKLNDNFELKSGLSFDHFSNANMSEPNLGINSTSVFAGLNYLIGNTTEKIIREPDAFTRESYVDAILSFGGKHTRALSAEVFFTSSFAIEWHYKINRSIHLGAGADVFFDSSIETLFHDSDRNYNTNDSFQTGLHISQSFVYDRFNIAFQEGVYIFLKEQIENYPVYTRGILKYRLSNRLSVRLAMKSHLHILDYPELGLGVRF